MFFAMFGVGATLRRTLFPFATLSSLVYSFGVRLGATFLTTLLLLARGRSFELFSFLATFGCGIGATVLRTLLLAAWRSSFVCRLG